MAKSFVSKLIGPAIEESGLLIKDQIAYWRFKNQIKIVNKAKDYCEKNKIAPKEVSLKLLCPLLDYAGLEEDEQLQDKWAVLLSNLIDSEQNIQNHVFPYILSQISIDEFKVIEKTYTDKINRISMLQEEIILFDKEKPDREAILMNDLQNLKEELSKPISAFDDFEARRKIRSLETSLRDLQNRKSVLVAQMEQNESIDESGVKEFEIANLPTGLSL